MLNDVAEKAAITAVREALTRLGVDHQNPLEVQKDFAALRDIRTLMSDPEWQKDQLHLRTWRKTMDGATKKGIFTAVGLIVTAVMTAVAFWLKGKGWWPF